MREIGTIFPPILELDFLEMSRFPVESHQTTDEKLGTIFGCLCQGLTEQKSIADGTIEHSVEDVCKGFALSYFISYHAKGKVRWTYH